MTPLVPKTTAAAPAPAVRKTYLPPRLVEHGDLARTTQQITPTPIASQLTGADAF